MSTPTITHPPPSNSESGVLKTTIMVLVLIFVVVQIKSCYKDHKQEAAVKKAQAAAYAATHPPAPPAPTIIKVGKEPTTHQFTDGCTTVWLEGNWVSYPQPLNANIRFFDQQGRLVLEQGAKKKGASLYPGFYRICSAPGSRGTGVQIWN